MIDLTGEKERKSPVWIIMLVMMICAASAFIGYRVSYGIAQAKARARAAYKAEQQWIERAAKRIEISQQSLNEKKAEIETLKKSAPKTKAAREQRLLDIKNAEDRYRVVEKALSDLKPEYEQRKTAFAKMSAP
jgi:septal ring factor EnvC (AmiA/AmiB activator)